MDPKPAVPRLSGPQATALRTVVPLTFQRPDVGSRPRTDRRRAVVAVVGALLILAATAPLARVGAAIPGDAGSSAIRPSIQYEEALAHANDKVAFAPGGRVSVPYAPRPADDWAVGGVAPRRLPAGRLSGQALRELEPGPLAPQPAESPPAALYSLDRPIVDPLAGAHVRLAAAVNPGGLRREVFGFLPYWELTDASTTLDWETLSTIAYFGIGAAANGNLEVTDKTGATTVGWSGWTSSKLTGVIQTAHTNNTRVVLTIQSFAWNSSGVTKQEALLGSEAARANLARQIAPTAPTSTSSRSSLGTGRSSRPWSARSGPSSTRSRPGTSSRSTRWAISATTRSRTPRRPAAPTRS